MPAQRKYPQELRERTMRLVTEARKEDLELSLNAAVIRIGQRVGVNPDTLRGWCKQAAIDAGERPRQHRKIRITAGRHQRAERHGVDGRLHTHRRRTT